MGKGAVDLSQSMGQRWGVTGGSQSGFSWESVPAGSFEIISMFLEYVTPLFPQKTLLSVVSLCDFLENPGQNHLSFLLEAYCFCLGWAWTSAVIPSFVVLS